MNFIAYTQIVSYLKSLTQVKSFDNGHLGSLLTGQFVSFLPGHLSSSLIVAAA